MEFSEDDLKWLAENYRKMRRADVARRLGCSATTVFRYAKEMGLTRVNKPVQRTTEEHHNIPYHGGYCVDCRHYIEGGSCARTKRETGALNEKECYREKSDG